MRYKVGFWHTDRFEAELDSPSKAAHAVRKRLARWDGGYRAKMRGNDWPAHFVDLGAVMADVRAFLDRAGDGDMVLVDSEKAPGAVAVRCYEVVAPAVQTIGNAQIDLIWTGVHAAFPTVASYGICNRRFVEGTTQWTEHCPWPADEMWARDGFPSAMDSIGSNAWDIGGPMSLLTPVATYLQREGQKWHETPVRAGLPVGFFIYNRREWDPVNGYRPYGGSNPHTGHIHVQGIPWHNGVQPRAACP